MDIFGHKWTRLDFTLFLLSFAAAQAPALMGRVRQRGQLPGLARGQRLRLNHLTPWNRGRHLGPKGPSSRTASDASAYRCHDVSNSVRSSQSTRSIRTIRLLPLALLLGAKFCRGIPGILASTPSPLSGNGG